jgi:hypothetical protein
MLHAVLGGLFGGLLTRSPFAYGSKVDHLAHAPILQSSP